MKTKISKKTRGISLATFLIAIVLSSVAIAQNSNITNGSSNMGTCDVTQSEVITYLQGYGYSNILLFPMPHSCNYLADTDYSYDTMVFCSETAIVEHEDVGGK